MNYFFLLASSWPASVTPYHVHYWVVEVHPRTAAIRSLDCIPLKFIVCYVFVPSIDTGPSKVEVQSSSALLHSAPLDPLVTWDSSYPLPPAAPSESSSDPKSASISVSVAAAATFSRAPFSSIPSWSHYCQDTRAPGHRVDYLYRSRIGRVAMNCAIVFFLRRIEVLIPTIT